MKKLVSAILFLALAPLTWAQDTISDIYGADWPKTDFTTSSIDILSEVFSGGPGKDGIPAILDPKFTPVSSAAHLDRKEPVIAVEIEGVTRAYPIRYLMWHEIVNDRINDRPITVTFCPLCNSAVVFDGRLNGQELTFGVSGNLRNSDMVMYDHQSESWWQQFTGEAIVGDKTGQTLTKLPAWMESWQSFKDRNPTGEVMAQPRYARSYGVNPYRGYDSASRPFLYNGENPPHGIDPLARVVVIGANAWPLTRFSAGSVIREAGYEISWAGAQASALDSGEIAQGRSITQIRVKDAKTGADVAHDVAFAFAFHAFHPDGVWMLGQ